MQVCGSAALCALALLQLRQTSQQVTTEMLRFRFCGTVTGHLTTENKVTAQRDTVTGRKRNLTTDIAYCRERVCICCLFSAFISFKLCTSLSFIPLAVTRGSGARLVLLVGEVGERLVTAAAAMADNRGTLSGRGGGRSTWVEGDLTGDWLVVRAVPDGERDLAGLELRHC